jgi:hypothetical protein
MQYTYKYVDVMQEYGNRERGDGFVANARDVRDTPLFLF